MTEEEIRRQQDERMEAQAERQLGTEGYLSKIARNAENVLFLENGAVVEVSTGYLGYLGYRKDVVLYRSGTGWKIWIEGKRTFPCQVARAPDRGATRVRELTLSRNLGRGAVLQTSDGSFFEVTFESFVTSLWLPMADLLLINESRMVNLGSGSDMVNVTLAR